MVLLSGRATFAYGLPIDLMPILSYRYVQMIHEREKVTLLNQDGEVSNVKREVNHIFSAHGLSHGIAGCLSRDII